MDNISEIKQKIDIVDLVGSYVQLKKTGRSYKGLCPFHSEGTPSFMVSQELQIYKCFGCGESGDIFKFVEKVEGVDFSSALEQLAQKAGVKLDRAEIDPQAQKKKRLYYINQLTAKFYHYILTQRPEGKVALDYLKEKRKLSDKTIEDFMLGYAPDNWDSLLKFLAKQKVEVPEMLEAGVITARTSGGGYIDKFRGRVMFPFTGIDTKIIGFNGRTVFDRDPKYLNTAETPVFHKGSFLFNLDKARLDLKKKGAVVVEGQMDVIMAWQSGITNVIASSGTFLMDYQLKTILRYTNDIVFCFDSDTAGIGAVYRAVEMAEKLGFNIRVTIIPAPYKDLDEALRAEPEKMKKALKDPVDVYDYYFVTVLKTHNKETAIGKKLILDDLAPIFSKSSNPVVIDHYSKKIAEELDISEETVRGVLKKGFYDLASNSNTDNTPDSGETPLWSENNPEGYLVALLLKADIDTMRDYGYKLQLEDFSEPIVVEVFKALIDYLKEDKKSFNIKQVLKRLPDDYQDKVSELYLWDFDGIIDVDSPQSLERELENAFKRMKKDSAKRAIKNLIEEIKVAELEKDSEKVTKLTKKVEKLKKNFL